MLEPGTIMDVSGQIEGNRAGLVELTQQLIAFRTESQDPNSRVYEAETAKCQEYIRARLERIGFTIEAFDSRWAGFSCPHTVATLTGHGGGRPLVCNGHIDVVPAGDESGWTMDPWAGVVKDNRIYGRGAADMKAGIAAIIGAIEAIKSSGHELLGDLVFHLVSDEEVVGTGSPECSTRVAPGGAVLCSEPSNLEIQPFVPGLAHMRIEVFGDITHAANRYKELHAGGKRVHRNAIEKGLKVVAALQELERIWANQKSHPFMPAGFNTIMPGTIVGGPGGGEDGRLRIEANPGTSPDYCSIEYSVWFYPDEDMESAKRECEEYLRWVCEGDPWLRERPPRITWGIRNVQLPGFHTDPSHPFVKCIVDSADRAGFGTTISAFGAASDISWYGERGIPGAIFGPGNIGCAHGFDEYVTIDDLTASTKVIAAVMLDWCGLANGSRR